MKNLKIPNGLFSSRQSSIEEGQAMQWSNEKGKKKMIN